MILDTNMERESGRKAQLSNITAAKVKFLYFQLYFALFINFACHLLYRL